MQTRDLQEKLKAKLKELFQYDNKELDFGIYKILNYKREQIDRFIETELIEEIQKQLNLLGEEETNSLKNELLELETQIQTSLGAEAIKNGEIISTFKETPLAKKYYYFKSQLTNANTVQEQERKIYNHLINFFSRYYEDGDFIAKRRFGKNEKYCIPYNGEEVLLHWVNKDQYYIKTTEYFTKYSFWNKTKDLRINFKIVQSEEEKGNVKAEDKKYFILDRQIYDFDETKNELNIFFDYRSLTPEEKNRYGDKVTQSKINEETLEILRQKLPENLKATLFQEEDGKSLLEKHLTKYTRRNTTDYFIHKDLEGFLERELDFYIKNELLDLEDLHILDKSDYHEKLRLYLTTARVFEQIAHKIINFLAQIEEFQKMIWEKKKFVTSTHYVITLDKIAQFAGEEFLQSILSTILQNESQMKEWKELFDLEIQSEEELQTETGWQKLPIDTKHFNEKFKWQLLQAVSKEKSLDEILDGVLIKSENWQALNLLSKKYHEKVQTIYIDPPYNTGNDGFLYKDNYKDSSWIGMMNDRLIAARELMRDDGVLFCSIDNNETNHLYYLINSYFNLIDRITLQVKAQSGDSSKLEKPFTDLKEDIYFASKTDRYTFEDIMIIKEYIDEKSKTIQQYNHLLKNLGIKSNKSFSFDIDKGKTTIDVYEIENFEWERIGKENKNEKYYLENIDKIVRTAAFSGEFKKQFKNKKDKVYFFEYEITRGKNKGKKAKIYVVNGEQLIFLKDISAIVKEKNKKKLVKLEKLSNIWTDITYTGIAEEGRVKLKNGKKPEKLLERIINLSIPKDSREWVLDFFAGSGTTPAVAYKMNKKFIAIELNNYFDDLMLKRMKYTMFGNSGGIKLQRQDSIGGFFKYHTLEQYEDALENIVLDSPQKSLWELPDYFVKYMLKWESKQSQTFLNLDKLKDPFNYKLKIIQDNQQTEINTDVVETFNYLIGLEIDSYRVVDDGRRYIFVFGHKDNKRLAIVWRSMENIDLEQDSSIIQENIDIDSIDELYINGDAIVPNFRPIEPIFKQAMFEKVQ